jgi:short-subunit dehydrogenase
VVYPGFTEHDPEKRILAANGTLIPPDRPAHHTQAKVARSIVRMIEKRKRRLIMTPLGILGWIAYRISPWLVERMILWALSKQWKIFKKLS